MGRLPGRPMRCTYLHWEALDGFGHDGWRCWRNGHDDGEHQKPPEVPEARVPLSGVSVLGRVGIVAANECDFCRRDVPCECAGAMCMCSCGRCMAEPLPVYRGPISPAWLAGRQR